MNYNYRNGNYVAFYVNEPFSDCNLGANATHDFVYYDTLRMWKGRDTNFPFIDSHNKNYNVRDDSDWEQTLKPRLHERLNNSKNIVLFLSSITKSSKALDEEMNFGISNKGLPVIVIYPDYHDKGDILDGNGNLKNEIERLWNNLHSFKSNMDKVPTLHIPMNKDIITKALNNENFMVNSKEDPRVFFYS